MITTTSSETRHLVDQITQKLENIEQIRVGLKQLDKTNHINQMITTTSSETRHLVDQITQKLENIEQIRVGLKQLDKTNYMKQISLSKTKINDIFDNISTILDTKEQ
eukprot:739162_1